MKNLIELPVSELKPALLGLGKVVGRSSTLPVLHSVRVNRNRAGEVRLQVTDLDSFATYKLKGVQAGPAVDFLVPLEPLTKLAKGSKDKLCIYPEGKNAIIQIFVGSTPLEHKVESVEAKEWPEVPDVEDEGATLSEAFREALKEAIECSSTDPSRHVLNSVYLDVEDPKAHYLASTNGRVVFSANSFNFDLKESLIIPFSKFLGWSGWWTQGETLLAIKPATKNAPCWLEFTVDQWTFITRGMDQPYPKWKQVIPTDDVKTTITIPPQAIDSVLEVIARIPGDDLPNHDITLNISKSTLVMQGKGKNQPEAASVPITQAQVEGGPVIVALNRDYLARALRFGLTTIEIVDPLTPITFKSEGKRLIVAPLRLETAPPKPVPVQTTPAEPKPVHKESESMRKEQSSGPDNGQPESPFKQLVQQVDNIKTALKGVMNDLNGALDLLRKAEKEKKHNDREVDAVREKLREIQSVTI
jgi:DNA polymerase III sliding clamp (beta) subunit (PCNA family)